MEILKDLEPKRVFHYFEEICNIPHGSYNEQAISNYLVDFAKEKGFTYYQDSLYNVVILVPASEGYEEEEPVILQGHMDMVCEKTSTCDKNMEKEGLSLERNDKYIYAKDTTLGGDDGIAVAYMLAIAEDDKIKHPALELVITVCEEVGMEGANGIDLSMIKGHRMLNLDSEEEGIFLSSCAGGISTHSILPVKYETVKSLDWYCLEVSGLLGGHSGCEIHKERANANLLLGRIIYHLRQRIQMYVCKLEGGKKDNAIPIMASVTFGVSKEQKNDWMDIVCEMQDLISKEYKFVDPDITINIASCNKINEKVLTNESLDKIVTLLMCLPNGVCGMSMSMPGLVETSLNLGIMRLQEDGLFLQHAIRSSVTTKKHYVVNQVKCLVESLGGTVMCKGEYPAWEYKEDSVVRDKIITLYEQMYGKKPVVEGIHAGLECGLLVGKINDLDCVAMGPDILDIHTTQEKLDIASTKRVYEFILDFLKMKDQDC